jgi:hypothetical protein
MDEPKDHVVIQNGQRATGTLTEKDANAQADKLRQQINEKAGQPVKESSVQVKRNLFG